MDSKYWFRLTPARSAWAATVALRSSGGAALVQRDHEEVLVRKTESTYLPLGCVHRMTNPGRIPLVLIEVQCGSYVGEDDIVRIEDTYGRT